jgi:hypothetical protein
MIWLAWRQFRLQAAVALFALVAAAVLLALTGAHLRDLYDASGVATCRAHGDCAALESVFLAHDKVLRNLLGPALLAVPALLGLFWGAPLLARELESGTYRLAWTQSIPRTRWLAVKVTLVGVAGIAVAELFSLMVSWWFSPVDKVTLNRFTPGMFDQRGIVAIGYAAFAVSLGVTAGAIIRKTLPAMATTLIGFVVVRLFFTYLVRPHILSPTRVSAPLVAVQNVGFAAAPAGTTLMAGNPSIPNAWIQSNRIVDAGGQAPSGQYVHRFLEQHCPSIVEAPRAGSRPAPAAFKECIAELSTRFHETVTYQPASNYWPFQVYETLIFLGFALFLIGFSFWWVRHRIT